MKRNTRQILVLGLMLLAFAAGCKKKPAPMTAPPPPPPPPPAIKPTATLSANPTSIERGQSATLTWTTDHATSVRIEPEVGAAPPSGNRAVRPNQSTTYRLTAEGPGGTIDASARVTVTVAPEPPRQPERQAPPTDGRELWPLRVKSILFDYDQSEIRADQKAAFDGNVAYWKEFSKLRVMIEGYCDERGSSEYNLALGDRRANTLKDALIAAGIAAERIDTISYGKEKPVCSEETEECWQKNRRGDFTIKK